VYLPDSEMTLEEVRSVWARDGSRCGMVIDSILVAIWRDVNLVVSIYGGVDAWED